MKLFKVKMDYDTEHSHKTSHVMFVSEKSMIDALKKVIKKMEDLGAPQDSYTFTDVEEVADSQDETSFGLSTFLNID